MTLNENEQKAFALSRKGYSSSGIAKVLDVTESTARKYLDTIEEEMGTEALTNY